MTRTHLTRIAPPAGACDCHIHVFEADAPRGPGAAPAWATVSAYKEMRERIGVSRTVVVQGGAYRTDNQVLLRGLKELGDSARGVAAVDQTATDAELHALTDAGVRGARFHMLPGGFLSWEDLPLVASRIAPFGWHIQLQMDGRHLHEREELIAGLPTEVMIDHVGKFLEPVTPDHPGFQALLRLLANGRTWLKLAAPYEVSKAGGPRYEDVGALAKAAAAAAPDRVVWASNWPHASRSEGLPDDRDLLDLLAEWVPDASARKAVLVDNPARLYGFPATGGSSGPRPGKAGASNSPEAYSGLYSAASSGLLTFPVTHFDAEHSFDESGFRRHIDWLLGYKPGILFAAGGTGEFFSLALGEYEAVVRAAVEEARGRLPVVAGCGYGTMLAKEYAAAAARAGASAILLLPHYLVAAEEEGLEAHVSAVCASTKLGVIVYNRGISVLGPDALARLCERCPNLVGFKDGVGDIELLTRIVARLGDRVFYVGGMPTHEVYAAAYRAVGVSNYSSAIFNFLPEFALDFYDAIQMGRTRAVQEMTRDFLLPYLKIRNRRKGYPVSIVKAGLAAIGRPAGPVRTPLTDLSRADMDDLSRLISGLPGLERGAA